jgi:hypothetical protein
VKEVHIVVGVLAIALNAAAALYGAWLYWRVGSSTWFWRVLRAGQVVVVLAVVLGGLAALTGRKPSGLHVLYGVLPLLVAVLAEQLRAASASMVLAARGMSSAAEVGRLPEDEQRVVALSIVQREQGVMALAAIVIVVLLARAAGT